MNEVNRVPSSGIETLRWRDNRIEMIDQRVLPARFDYLAYDSAQGVADAIRSMVVRGAPAIGCAAAYGVALESRRIQNLPPSDFFAQMDRAFDLLGKSRPTAVNLFWALRRMQSLLQQMISLSAERIANRLIEEAHHILAEDVRINREMGLHGSALLADGARVLTHCNAGALATAGHGTALGVIRSAIDAGKRISVIADETRPFLQGARLTVWELMQEHIPVTLITDNMAGHLMSRGNIDAVIVGADRIAANGDVANKIGTYMVAVLAYRHSIPFYVAAPLSTIDLQLPSGLHIPIEERASGEVRGFADVQWASSEVLVRNPAFDITPADLITALITEKGIVTTPNRKKITALFG